MAVGDDRREAVSYVRALREHWLLICVLVAVAVAVAAAYSLTATERYESSADVLVTPLSPNDETFVGMSLLRDGFGEAQPVVTAARIVTSPEVVGRADRRLGVTGSAALVTVKPLSQSNIVTMTGTASSAERAARIANVYAESLIAERSEVFEEELQARVDNLEERLAAIPPAQRGSTIETATLQQTLAQMTALLGAPDPTLRVLSRAVPPGAPTWPRPVLSIAVAMLAALLLGSGLAVALEVANPRLTREDELLLNHRLPILARVPRLPRARMHDYLMGRQALPPAAGKAYRILRANLATAGEGMEAPKTILVTSASPGEGKTMTAVNLAVTMASAGTRVVLVDADLYRPMVATILGVTGRRDGFVKLLTGANKPASALVPAPAYGSGLRLLLASPEQAPLMRTLNAAAVERMLNDLSKEADVIIFDTPPLPEVAEALALAAAVEAVLIAVRLGHTRRDRLAELRRMFALRGVTPLGFVVTLRRHTSADETTYYERLDQPTVLPRREPRRRSEGAAARRR
jgi:capsular exopolysaccharide synthesis family protein